MIGLCLQLFVALQLTTPSQPTARDALQSAKNAVVNARSAAYVVTRDYLDSSGKKHKGQTSVLIMKSPFAFRAEHHLEDKSSSAIAVSDGKTTRTIADGKSDEHTTFAPEGTKAMIVEGDVEFDVALTWHLLLDPEYLQKAMDSGRTLYLWEDDIEGDACHLIVYAREHWTDYLWISAKTGYARAIQRVNMIHGPALLSPRYEIGDIRLNPEIPSDAFRPEERPSTRPLTADSSKSGGKTEELAATTAPLDIIGRHLPDLELRDPQYKAALISSLRGRPALIRFWAPWCGPCLEELGALEKLHKNLDAELQIVAIAMQDRREEALDFIAAHQQYKFMFFTDPDMERETSPLASFFGVVGIPVTVLTDAEGKIIDRWSGFDGEENLRKKLERVLRQNPLRR
jgi:thiol-disulfide isomerase/thioredoxin/outer membrane lipoprotein-sorting protein